MSFANGDEVFHYMAAIFKEAFADEEIGPKLAESGLVFRISCTEPDAVLVVDTTAQAVHHGEADGVEPTATLLMKSETANAYWQGKVNLGLAMAKRNVKVEGNSFDLLKLTPLSKKLFPIYVEGLKREGRDDLLV